MRNRRRAGALVIALVMASSPGVLHGQRFWRSNLYPYAFYSTIDSFWGALHYGVYSPIGFIERPEPHLAALNVDAAASTQGSYQLAIDAQAPAWWDGWRIGLALGVARANRLGYFGVGNATVYDDDSTNGRPYFYRVSRTSRAARLTVQRQIVGPFRLLAGATLDHTDFRELPGESLFRRDHTAGAVDSSTVPFGDAVFRAGAVVDVRDHEIDPHRGVFVEALYAAGEGYTRLTGAVRGYVQPAERLTLAGRLAVERMNGDPPVAAQLVMESSERPYIAVGGYRSLRGFHDARFVGPGKLVGGLEVRYAFLWVPTLVEAKAVAFYDVGRIFGPGEEVRLTKSGLHEGWGLEVAVRVLRNTLAALGVGFGEGDWQLLFGTGWSY